MTPYVASPHSARKQKPQKLNKILVSNLMFSEAEVMYDISLVLNHSSRQTV